MKDLLYTTALTSDNSLTFIDVYKDRRNKVQT